MDPALAGRVFETPASDEQIRAFQSWERSNAARMRLRYTDFPVTNTFGLRPSDVVTVNPEVQFEFSGKEPRVLDSRSRYIGTLANAPADLLRHFLAALDGKRSLAAICSREPFAEHARPLEGLVAALLGGPFLVAAVDELEAQLPAVELLRFPTQSPYAMPREHWENSIVVRQALDVFYAGLDDPGTFTDGLRGLHRLATLGANARNYYGGAGGIATVPGELRDMTISNRFDERKKWILGEWLRLLELPYALVESGSILSANGVSLGRITYGGRQCDHPYGDAGEELRSQLNEIRVQLAQARAALRTDRGGFLRHCALFHHAFVHAHPFGNINNSIAMNIVNDLLGRAGIGVIPHLYFDQAACFLQVQDYVRLFERGLEAHVINDEAGRERPATQALLERVRDR